MIRLAAMMATVVLHCGIARAQDHHHEDVSSAEPVRRPRVFLDRSPRVVAYQLKRLSNERLLLVERDTSDPKYAPVYAAILVRAGMSRQAREEALASLVAINQSSPVTEIIKALATLSTEDRQQRRSARELSGLGLNLSHQWLNAELPSLESAVASDNAFIRAFGFGALIMADQIERARALADDDSRLVDLLASVGLVPDQDARDRMRTVAIACLDQSTLKVRRAAIGALQHMRVEQADTFRRVANYVPDAQTRDQAVRTLLTIPSPDRDSAVAATLVKTLVGLAEETSAAKRTSSDFVNAMQLADQLFANVAPEMARAYRARLRAVTVRVVQIHTVEEEMRYDVSYFAVEANRPVQVVLKNEDLMPHNLVITTPGSLQQVAELGLAAGPAGYRGKQYIPDSPDVLFATHMVAPGAEERLTFTAPLDPGEYPYVCTFPRHWMRMYGVMLVVDDLDEWLRNPIAPADPLGSTRSIVKNWTIADFDDEVLAASTSDELRIAAGKQLFVEATCAQCHKAQGSGGAVGPALDGVFERWKGDRRSVLREILDPSHQIDPKYAVHLIITSEGETISGIVKSEDKASVSILANPESEAVTVVPIDSIEERVKTSTSMMPKGLLDRFEQDEILQILAYLESLRAL